MSERGRIDPRYVVVFGACLTQFTVIGLLFAYGVFFKVFEDEFGWSRTLLSSCSSVAFLVMGTLAIVGGRMSDRYGPRIVLCISGALFSLGFVLASQLSQPWQLIVVFGLLLGVGLSTHDVVTLSTVARWFERKRGIMTGVVKTGTAVGQVVIPPTVALLIATIGWRSASVVIGIVAAGLLLAAALMVKAPPKPAADRAASQAGLSYAGARRTRTFWTLCAVQFLFFPSLMAVPLHIVVHATDLGMTTAAGATLLSVIGGISAAGRLTVWALSGRIRGKRAYVMCFLPLIASLLALLVIESPWLLYFALAVYGFGHGGFFIVVAPTVAEYFGTVAHGAIFGSILFFGTIGGAAGPIVAG